MLRTGTFSIARIWFASRGESRREGGRDEVDYLTYLFYSILLLYLNSSLHFFIRINLYKNIRFQNDQKLRTYVESKYKSFKNLKY